MESRKLVLQKLVRLLFRGMLLVWILVVLPINSVAQNIILDNELTHINTCLEYKAECNFVGWYAIGTGDF